MLKRLLDPSRSAAWAVLLVLLPITSMPLIKGLVGSSTVASPSLLPLAFLALFWLVPFLVRRGRLPGQARPLIGFALVGLLASAAANFLPIPSFKNISMLPEELKALITLLIGLSYYLIAATWVSSPQRLKASLRWINLGGFLILLWSFAQAAAWFGFHRYPDWMRNFQDFISLGPLYRQRVAGFALEPSWLAHQLNMLYLPLWLAASVQRTSAHRRGWLGISVENLLLAGGVAVLVLSFSRAGLLAFFAAITYLFLRFNVWLVRWLRTWLAGRLHLSSLRSAWLSTGLTAGLLLIYTGGLLGGLFVYSRVYPPMANVFKLENWKASGFLTYANKLQFGERAAYWQAGWAVFNDYPLLGVGLGNAGYFFQDKLPVSGWQMSEVRSLMYRTVSLPNTKNLWVRLLSETGLIGLAFFIAWLVLMLLSASALQHSRLPLMRWLGFLGVFVITGLLFEGFSIDSFAMPYYWISLGLVTAAARMVGCEETRLNQPVYPLGGNK